MTAMPAEVRARVRERVLAGLECAVPPGVSTLDDDFARQFARERALDAHGRELDRREASLERRRQRCDVAERLLADRLQALAMRCHLLDAAASSLADEAPAGPG
jgi:hypothetical protein